MTAVLLGRPAWEVADVMRDYGTTFRARHGGHLTTAQTRALRDLARCRTAALGGHVEHCRDCGHDRLAYNSCRNRHCPKCQAQARARWLQREAQHLLPVEYHHVVFTLPAALSDLGRANPIVVYDLLFQAAAATLRAVAANPQRLGAQVGVLLVLHTWGQNLHHHPHVHGVVSGGGLSCNTQGVVDPSPRWIACRPGFFLPVRVLSRVFRGKFLAGLRAAGADGRLRFSGRLAALAEPTAFAALLGSLAVKDWVVYAKPPFGGPAQVLKYLARYTHRVAISNHRLVAVADGQVTFTYKDYADDHRTKTLTLSADEFLHRFLHHVLPQGFVKVRHYGLLANRCRAGRLAVCRWLLLVVAAATTPVTDPRDRAEPPPPAVPPTCPQCGGTRFERRALVPAVRATGPDTS